MNPRLVFLLCEGLWLFAQASYGVICTYRVPEVPTYIFTYIPDQKGGSMDHVSLDGVGLLRRRMAGVFATALAIVMLLPGASSAQEREEGGDGRLLRAGNGPGPAANGPGPGCNIIPPLASIGTKVDISQFPPPDSLTNP